MSTMRVCWGPVPRALAPGEHSHYCPRQAAPQGERGPRQPLDRADLNPAARQPPTPQAYLPGGLHSAGCAPGSAWSCDSQSRRLRACLGCGEPPGRGPPSPARVSGLRADTGWAPGIGDRSGRARARVSHRGSGRRRSERGPARPCASPPRRPAPRAPRPPSRPLLREPSPPSGPGGAAPGPGGGSRPGAQSFPAATRAGAGAAARGCAEAGVSRESRGARGARGDPRSGRFRLGLPPCTLPGGGQGSARRGVPAEGPVAAPPGAPPRPRRAGARRRPGQGRASPGTVSAHPGLRSSPGRTGVYCSGCAPAGPSLERCYRLLAPSGKAGAGEFRGPRPARSPVPSHSRRSDLRGEGLGEAQAAEVRPCSRARTERLETRANCARGL